MKKEPLPAYQFPSMLIELQDELTAVRTELHALLKSLPWSREPAEAWSRREGDWFPSSRPDSPGWQDSATTVVGLRERERELVATIISHAWWDEIAPAERSDARSALKHHHERARAAAPVDA